MAISKAIRQPKITRHALNFFDSNGPHFPTNFLDISLSKFRFNFSSSHDLCWHLNQFKNELKFG